MPYVTLHTVDLFEESFEIVLPMACQLEMPPTMEIGQTYAGRTTGSPWMGLSSLFKKL